MVAPLIPIAIGLGAAAGAGIKFVRNVDRARKADAAKARAREAYLQLGFALESVDADAGPVAANHLAQARRKWDEARALIGEAADAKAADEAYAVIAEGLEQITLARAALGSAQPGAELRPAQSPTLDAAQHPEQIAPARPPAERETGQ
jgi:hypothetical protein